MDNSLSEPECRHPDMAGGLIGKLQRLFDALWDKSIAGTPDAAPVPVFAGRRKLG